MPVNNDTDSKTSEQCSYLIITTIMMNNTVALHCLTVIHTILYALLICTNHNNNEEKRPSFVQNLQLW